MLDAATDACHTEDPHLFDCFSCNRFFELAVNFPHIVVEKGHEDPHTLNRHFLPRLVVKLGHILFLNAILIPAHQLVQCLSLLLLKHLFVSESGVVQFDVFVKFTSNHRHRLNLMPVSYFQRMTFNEIFLSFLLVSFVPHSHGDLDDLFAKVLIALLLALFDHDLQFIEVLLAGNEVTDHCLLRRKLGNINARRTRILLVSIMRHHELHRVSLRLINEERLNINRTAFCRQEGNVEEFIAVDLLSGL